MLATLRQQRLFAKPAAPPADRGVCNSYGSPWTAPPVGLPSATIDWAYAAHSAFAKLEPLHVVRTMDHARVSSAAALIAQHRGGFWRLTTPGYQLGLPWDAAVDELDALPALATAVLAHRTSLLLDRVPANSPLPHALAGAARGRALLIRRQCAPYRAIAVDESFEQPERRLPARMRRRLLAARSRAERVGELRIEIHTPNLQSLPNELDTVLDHVPADQHAARGTLDQAALDRAVFLRHFAESACMDGSLRICRLALGEHQAAALLAVESGNAFWILQAVSAARFARFRPEQLLACAALRYASQANLDYCALWCPRPAGFEPWPACDIPCVTLRLYPATARGVLTAAADAVRAGFQQLCSGARRLREHFTAKPPSEPACSRLTGQPGRAFSGGR